MKTLNKLILTFTFFMLLFSCTKENVTEESELQNQVQYFFNGKSIQKKDIDETKELIYYYSSPKLIHVFDSDKKYESFLIKLSNSTKDNIEKDLISNAIKINKIAVKIAKIAQQKSLSKGSQLPEEINSLHLEMEKMKNENAKALGTVILYKEPEYGGSAKYTLGTIPRLRGSWRNVVSSFKIRGTGLLTMCDRTFFRGSRRVYPIITHYNHPHLGADGFDNRLESYF